MALARAALWRSQPINYFQPLLQIVKTKTRPEDERSVVLLSTLLIFSLGGMLRYQEKDGIQVINGYASLAAFIASDRDRSTSIFRRFDRLSARNLLYLQSELAELEAQQDALDAQDAGNINAATEDIGSVRDWHKLVARSKNAANVREKEQLRLVLEVRKKLQEYSVIFFFIPLCSFQY